VSDATDRIFQGCQKETEELVLALETASAVGMGRLLPRLRKIAVSSIYGVQSFWATQHNDGTRAEHLKRTERYVKCLRAFDTFCTSGRLDHLCVRDNVEPLCMMAVSAPRYHSSPTGARFSRTVHFNAKSPLPLPLGYLTRYVSEASPSHDWSDMVATIHSGISETYKTLEARRDSEPDPSVQDPFLLEIYSSSSRCSAAGLKEIKTAWPPNLPPPPLPSSKGWSLDQQREIIATLGKHMQLGARRISKLKDSTKWFPLGDAPTCLACSEQG
jgi:hypothetical protein